MDTLKEERFAVFSTLLSSVHNNMQKLKNKYAKDLDLKPVHVLWINILSQHPEGLTSSELAKVSKINRSLVSREINYLLERELVQTSSCSKDLKYRDKLQLTELGKEKSKVIRDIAMYIQQSVNCEISDEELFTFYKVLNNLAEKFENLVMYNEIQQIIENED